MEILKKVWENEILNFVSNVAIQRCWRKADVLPITWNQDINNEVGSRSMSEKEKTIDRQACLELCNLMNEIVLKCNSEENDLSKGNGVAFQHSFVTDGALNLTELEEMAEMWMTVEDNEVVSDLIMNDELDKLERYEEFIEEEECIAEVGPIVQLQSNNITHL